MENEKWYEKNLKVKIYHEWYKLVMAANKNIIKIKHKNPAYRRVVQTQKQLTCKSYALSVRQSSSWRKQITRRNSARKKKHIYKQMPN